MKTAKFYGGSDDLIEVSGIDGADEFYATAGGDDPYQASFLIESRPFSLIVHALYGPAAVWSFAPSLVDEDVPLPPWPIRVTASADCTYSTELQIDVPDDAVLHQVVMRRGKWEHKRKDD